MDCNEVLEKLGDYIDDDVREELCRAIQAHLTQCRNCQVEVDTVRKTIVLYQSESRIEVPAGVSSRLEAALAQEYGRGASGRSSD